MRCADAQNLVSSHASLPDWRGSQGNKLMRETNQDFAAWIESEKMAEKKIKKVSASAASRWVLELDVKKQWLNYSEEAGYVTKINCTLCSKYQDKLKYLKNFSTAMITGITGSSIKKDNVKKHATSDAHVRTRQQQLFKFKDSLVYCLSTNVSLVLLMSHYESMSVMI